MKGNGSSVLSSNLKGGVNESQAPQYELSAQLPESLQGAVSWKLVISENEDGAAGDESPKDSYKGISFVGLNNKKNRISIKILQLNSNSNYKDKGPKYFDCNPYDLESLMSKGNANKDGNWFGKELTSTLVNTYYDLKIKTVKAADFKEIYKDKDWIGSYDMLILGFADSYDGPDAAGLQQVQKFADTGKAVLFCHDNSSYRNLSKETNTGQWYIGYHDKNSGDKFTNAFYYNVLLRSQAFMDVYGISDIRNTIDGSRLGGTTYWGSLTNNQSGILASGGELTAAVQQAVKALGYSVAYKPKSGGNAEGTTVPEVHGFSDTATAHRLKSVKGVMYSYSNADTTNINGDSGALVTKKVDQVNKGQITSYPYNINAGEFARDNGKNGYSYTGDTAQMGVSSTHAQWYQLNTNADKIVVWYTVENQNDSSSDNLYGYNDCVNNYYIYSCGNITYTGAGHNKGKDVTEQEAKLFVNTMIAAFRTSVSTPSAKFVSGPSGDDEISQAKIEVQTDADGDASDKEISGAVATAKLYFRISDNTVAKDKTNGIYLYDKVNTSSKNGETTYTPEGEALKNVEVRDTDDKVVKADSLKSGKTYYITIPTDSKAFRDLTGGKDSSEIWLQPYNEVGRSGGAGSITKGKPVKLSISLIKSGLMNLG